MLEHFRKITLSVALAAVCSASTAATVTEAVEKQPENIFYRSGAEGWYWYQDPVKEEEQELVEEPPPPPPAKPPEVTREEPKTPEEAPPAPFSLKWVQEMLPRYKERAWDNPTQENVQAYFLVQRFAMDRATKFADVAQQVVVGNALLDESMRRPLASFATTYVDRASAAKTDDLLKKLTTKVGIFFFYKSDCRFCEAQAPLLGHLEDMGFDVLAVSLDGGELQSRRFKNTKIDSGQAEALGVRATPAMFLMTEDGRFSALAQSVLSYSELRSRILIVAQREGWITEEEFKETQPYLNPNQQIDLSRELPKLLQASSGDPSVLFGSPEQSEKVAGLPPAETLKLTDSTNFIEPERLIALFGRAAQTSGTMDQDGEGEEESEDQI